MQRIVGIAFSLNLWNLYLIHESIGFEGNLERLVEATQNIQASGVSFELNSDREDIIRAAPHRAIDFCKSPEYQCLKGELDTQVAKHSDAILAASMIDNVKIRGNLIEYIVAGDDEELKDNLIKAVMKTFSFNKIFKLLRTWRLRTNISRILHPN